MKLVNPVAPWGRVEKGWQPSGSARGSQARLGVGDIAPLAGRRVEKHGNQTTALGIDKTLWCGLPVRSRRIGRQRPVTPALDQHTAGQNGAPGRECKNRRAPPAKKGADRGGSQHAATGGEQRGAQQLPPQGSGSI